MIKYLRILAIVALASGTVSCKKASKPRLGIEVRAVTSQEASALKLRESSAVAVVAVMDGGRAFKAGLAPGDIITGINNKPLDLAGSDRAGEFAGLIFSLEGPSVELTLLREKQAKKISIPLEAN